MSAMLKALPGLIAAIAGVGLAWLAYQTSVSLAVPIVVTAAVMLIGFVSRRVGQTQLRKNPNGALPLLEGWSLTLLAVPAIAVAASIVVAVWLAQQTPEGTPADTKQVLTASAAAVTGFLSAAFIKAFDDFDGVLGGGIAKDFLNAFEPCNFATSSEEYRAVYADTVAGASGWGFAARRKRAADFSRQRLKLLPAGKGRITPLNARTERMLPGI